MKSSSSNLLGDEIAIPLAEIVGVDPCNARPDDDSNVEALAASLRSSGHLHALIVRPFGNLYRVLIGARTWRAMKLNGDWSAGEAVFVRARIFNGGDTAAKEASLSENFTGAELHALDEALRFAELVAETSFDRVANDLGVSRRFLRERIALARLPAPVRAAWRAGAISEASAKAYTIVDDAEAQLAVLARPAIADVPIEIKAALRSQAVSANAPLARFVGMEAYVAAGGMVIEDLFDPDVWFADRALLQRLEREKLGAAADKLRAEEGWGFAETEDPDARLAAAVRPNLLPSEVARRIAIEAELNASPGAEENAAAIAELEQLERIGIMRATTPADRKRLGVLVTADTVGGLIIERGMRAASSSPAASADQAAGDGEQAEPTVAEIQRRATRAGFPPLVHQAARRIAESAATRALGQALGANAALAGILALSSLALGRGDNPIGLRRHSGPRGAKSELTLRVGRARCLRESIAIAKGAEPGQILAALYDCFAASVDLRDHEDDDVRAVLEIAALLSPDLARSIADNFDYVAYFRDNSRAAALEAIRDCAGKAAEMSAGWRKDDALAEEAARLARAKYWLPEWLRVGPEAPAAAPAGKIEAAE